MLFAAVSSTLIEFGANPRWLGGEIAATLILHTRGQTLSQHLHLHCLVAAGALHADGHWIRSRRGFLFPVTALSQVFRGKFLAAPKQGFSSGTLRLAGETTALAQPRMQQRFLLHVLPRGFMRIRHYGPLANRAKRLKLAQTRSALDHPPPAPHPSRPESVEAFWLRVAKLDIHQCPHCHAGRMVLIGSLHSPLARGPPALRPA